MFQEIFPNTMRYEIYGVGHLNVQGVAFSIDLNGNYVLIVVRQKIEKGS